MQLRGNFLWGFNRTEQEVKKLEGATKSEVSDGTEKSFNTLGQALTLHDMNITIK